MKKTDYNTKINEVESKNFTDHDNDKYITTQEFKIITKFYCKISTRKLSKRN